MLLLVGGSCLAEEQCDLSKGGSCLGGMRVNWLVANPSIHHDSPLSQITRKSVILPVGCMLSTNKVILDIYGHILLSALSDVYFQAQVGWGKRKKNAVPRYYHIDTIL